MRAICAPNAVYVTTSAEEEPLRRQEQTIRAVAMEWEWREPEVYSDLGGTSDHLPGRTALLEAVRSGRIKSLMVLGLDRLVRGSDRTFEIINELVASGVELHTPQAMSRLHTARMGLPVLDPLDDADATAHLGVV